MDDSAEGEVVLQFLWAHVELLTQLSRLCPIPAETLVCLCAILDRTAVVEVGALLAVIITCLLLIRHPECHSHIREAFFLLPRAIRSLRQKCYLTGIGNDCSKQTIDAACTQRAEETEWSRSDSMSEAFAMQGRRAHMEDRFCMLGDPKRNIYIYGIFDGHGGKAAADYTNKQLFPSILERIRQAPDEMDISTMQDILRQEILRVDEAFVKESKKTRDYSGTTCLVAVILNDTLIVANVGDSRGVMATNKGRSVALSFDHKPQQIKEQKRIQDAGGFISFNGVWRVAGILATSRAIGDYPLKDRNLVTAEPDILTFNLTQQEGLFIILASDGLWDTFSNEDAVAFIRERRTLEGASKELAKRAHQKGSQDNITVIVIDLSKYGLLQGTLSKTRTGRDRASKVQAQTVAPSGGKDRAEERSTTTVTAGAKTITPTGGSGSIGLNGGNLTAE